MTYIDWIGSLGVFLILLAYFLNVIGKCSSKSLVFILLNLVGAALACYASILLDYMPFVVLEAAWVIVSLYGLYTLIKANQV